ncbi:MAG: sulfur oxidation c-type cytochrome SoxA [Thiobacillus sp.]
MQYKAISLSLALALAAPLAWGEASVADYRAALADKDANPGFLIVDRGEMLFKEKRGPRNVSLEKCDFGLGAGKLKGAYAQLPRYFKDTKRVQDLESRLMTCMTALQGFSEADIKQKLYADQRRLEDNMPMEAIAAYVAYQSDGMKINPPMKHAAEKETAKLGEAMFWRRHGPMDFSCATCHAEDGKRVRLQALVNVYNPEDAQATMSTWPTYRVSHGVVRNLQHRMWDCHWQMRTPDIDYGSPATVALISFLTNQAKGGKLDLPGIKR